MKQLFLVAVCLAALSAAAASGKTIRGTVTDLNDQPLPKATVVVENKTTHRRIMVKTDVKGRFVIRHLRGTNYSVSVVSDSGNGIRLRLDQKGPAVVPRSDSQRAHDER